MNTSNPVTPSRVYAGFVTRAIALVVDLLIVSILVITNAYLAQMLSVVIPMGRVSIRILDIYTIVASFGLPLVYFMFFWMLAGQTPGKALMGIRIVAQGKDSIGFGAALLRFVGYALSSVLFLGFLWVIVDRRRQGFHDKLARTVVIHGTQPFQSPAPRPVGGVVK